MKKNLLFLLVMLLAFQSKQFAQVTIDGAGSNYTTIQAAVDGAGSGATIRVAPGVYNENVLVNKSLTILGPQEAISPNEGLRLNDVGEAIITGVTAAFTVNTPGINVVVKGFTIKNGSPLTDGHDAGTENRPNVVFEKNRVIDGQILYNGYVWGDIAINDNYFNNPAGGVTHGGRDAIYLQSGNNVIITKNVIQNTFLGILVKGDPAKNQTVVSVLISQNKITTSQLEGIQIGFTLGSATVSRNEVSNAGLLAGSDDGGINIYQPNNSGSLDIINNKITNSQIGVAVKNEYIPTVVNSRITVANNSMDLTNPVAIHNFIPGTLKAECNWLGADCPANGRVIGDVDYSTWLRAGVDTDSLITGFQGDLSSCGRSTLGLTKDPEVNPACFGGKGSATIRINGCASPFTYRIFNGSENAVTGSQFTINDLAAGSYTIYVTDAVGNVKDISVRIIQPSQITVTSSVTNASCLGGTKGSITLTGSGGTGTLSYTITNTSTNVKTGPQSSGIFNNVNQGTYSYTVKDANNCTVNSTTNLSVASAAGPTSIAASVTSAVKCTGASNGQITVTAVGGVTPYTFTLTGTSATSPNTTGVFSNLGAGNYTYSVTDKNGCTRPGTSTITLTAPATLTSTAVAKAPTNCTGSANGTVNISVTGGTGTKTITLTGTGLSNSTGSFINLAAGTYNYTVKDANNCITGGSVTVPVNTTNCAPACTFVTTTSSYYGGFEGGLNSISPTGAGSDLKKGLPANGTYQVVQNVGQLGGGGYLNITAKTGGWFMAAHTSNDASDRVWYKKVSVTPRQTYKFCASVRLLKNLGHGANFIVSLYANNKQIGTARVTNSWVEICGEYEVP
ncbi:MAG: hypothetical protein JWQ96_1253, partial [Segetibacter sp.]|nr:hypothetical protein [Segetibacter sp.]